jgi:hypothetical protein
MGKKLTKEEFKGVFGKRKAKKANARLEKEIDAEVHLLARRIQALQREGGTANLKEAKELADTVMRVQEDLTNLKKNKDPKQANTHYKNLLTGVKQDLDKMRDAPVTVKVGGKDVQLRSARIVPGIEALLGQERDELLADVGKKIENGKQKFAALKNASPEQLATMQPSREDVADLMWYLRSVAEDNKGEPFMKGSLTLPDEGSKLRGYFDKCSEVYRRDSSHLKSQQKIEGQKARGIDFYDGGIGDSESRKKMLPYGMNTVLVQSVKTGDKQRLFVKMETEGARVRPSGINPLRLPAGIAMRLRRLTGNRSKDDIKSRKLRLDDVKHSLAHLANLLGPKEDGGTKAFREQVPDEIVDAYVTMFKQIKNKEVLKLLQPLKKKAKAYELCKMMQGLQNALEDVEMDTHTRELVETFSEMVADKYEDAVIRFGDEVVLQEGELAGEEEEEVGDQPKQEEEEEEYLLDV